MGESGIERIVVGLDGSEQARAALDWAIRLARTAGAEVIAVYAARPVYPNAGALSKPGPDSLARAKFRTEWCKALPKAGVRYQTFVEEGRPASVITGIADRVDADVIVVGRRGRGGVAELLLGSVSNELTHRGARPVLVISRASRAGATVGDAARTSDHTLFGRWAHQGIVRSP